MTDDALTEFEAFASLHGLFLEDGLVVDSRLVELESGLDIVEVDPLVQKTLFQTQTVRASAAYLHGDRVVAIRHRFGSPVNAGKAVEKRTDINETLDRALRCLRVYRSARIYVGGIIHWAADRSGPVDIFPRSWPENLFALYPLLTRDDLEGVRRLWQSWQCDGMRRQPRIDLAARWFSASHETNRLEEKIVMLMTAAETLTGATRGREKAKRVARSLSTLGIDSVGGEDVEKHLWQSYKLRNHVLHEGGVVGFSDGGKPAGLNELSTFIAVTTEHVRLALLTAVRSAATDSGFVGLR